MNPVAVVEPKNSGGRSATLGINILVAAPADRTDSLQEMTGGAYVCVLTPGNVVLKRAMLVAP